MLHIEAMSVQSHFSHGASSQPNVGGVSSIQSGNNTQVNVTQSTQPSTSIGNSMQDSHDWNWNKKSFLSRVVSWIKGEVYFFAHNNKVVALKFKSAEDLQNSLQNFSRNFYVKGQSYEETDISLFKRLKAVVWGDDLKEVKRDFESAKMEAKRAKMEAKRAKMEAYLSDFFVFCRQNVTKYKNGIIFVSDSFISNFREQIGKMEKGMKNLFEDSSIDIDAKLEFKSKFLDDLIKLLDVKFFLKYGEHDLMVGEKKFFNNNNKFNTDSLKDLFSLKARLELYKQATQGHLYQAKIDGQINYILVNDEKQLQDYQLKNSEITFLKVPGKNVSLDENLRFKVEVNDDRYGGTKIIEEPKVMDLIEFQARVRKGNTSNDDLSDLFKKSSIDPLKCETFFAYLKIDPSKVSAFKNWVEYDDNTDKIYIQTSLKGIIQGNGTLSGKVESLMSMCGDIERQLCLGSMLLYNDDSIYREQNMKLFQLMLKNEDLYEKIHSNASMLNLRGLDEEQKTILWKMYVAQWRREFLDDRAK